MDSTGTTDERGASELVGVVLLFGLVAIASLVVILSGTPGIEAVQGETDEQQAETILQEFDSRVSSLTASDDTTQAQFDLGETDPSEFTVSDSGWMNVTVNEDPACSANLSMSSVNYEDDNVQVGYQAGGVWNSFGGGNSTMVSEPSVVYRDGSIDIDITNISGNLDKTKNDVSMTGSSAPSDAITQGECIRPDNVTIAVQSRYYQAWGRYLETEFEGSVTTDDSDQRAVLFLSQSDLPERVNDAQNNVVTLAESNVRDSDGDGSPDGITFDKGAGNSYTVSATSLSEGAPTVGNITSIDSATNVTRTPIDVMFVIDESGSMGRSDSVGGQSRLEAAQTAAKRFVGQLNESQDRAGVVSYNRAGEYRLTDDDEYLTKDFSSNGINGSIESIDAGGGTSITIGLQQANTALELQSNGTRDRAIVLLTDGRNNYYSDKYGRYNCENTGDPNDDDPYDCPLNRETVERANDSAANGVTVYTVGYGDDDNIDQALLQTVADQTGGSFYQATSASQLNAVFDDIRREIARTQTIARAPISSNYTTEDGQVYAPQTAGQVGEFAQYSVNGEEFTNINDPTAESRFSHSFAVGDGESVDFRVHDFECADDGWVGTGQYRTNDSTSYQVVRCTEIADKTETIQPTEIFLDGDNIETTHSLLTTDQAFWQEDINASFAARSDISVCRSRSGGLDPCDGANFGEIDLKSNQALAYYDLPDGPKSNNRLLMLYEIGIADSNAETSDVINIQLNNVTADA